MKKDMKNVKVYVNASDPILTDSYAGWFAGGEIASPSIKNDSSLNGTAILSFMTPLSDDEIKKRLKDHLNGGYITEIER